MTPDSFRVSFAPLSLQEVYQLADDGANGAIVLMSGTVREQTDGKPVIYLDYQAYEPMAIEVFRQIAGQIRQTWPDTNRVVIHHRTGKLQIGEISVLVAVGCPIEGKLSQPVVMLLILSSIMPPSGKKNTGLMVLVNGLVLGPVKRSVRSNNVKSRRFFGNRSRNPPRLKLHVLPWPIPLR